MKSLLLVPIAALLLAGCVNKDKNPDPEDSSAQPPLQRLVGTLTIVEDYSLVAKSKPPSTRVTRKMQLSGKIDQLVRVSEGGDGTLTFETEGNVPLTISGTVIETGKMASKDPDSNSIVESHGESAWAGTLKDVDLAIRRSQVGRGDEIRFRFLTPMSGKLVMSATMRDGSIFDLAAAGGDPFISVLETVPDEPTKRVFKNDFAFFPALGATPSDAFSKQMHEALKANPGIAHIGLATGADRRSWTYSGHKQMSPPDSETPWGETATLSLKLTKP